MKKIFLPLLVSCCAVFFSCTNEPAKQPAAGSFNLDTVKAAIAVSNASYGTCFATGDSAAFVSHYTSDACINPSNMPKMCGPQAINGFFVGGYKMGIRSLTLTTAEVMGSEAAVVETGTYEVLGDKGVSFDKGKFIVVWKEENGKWKMHRDIWNTDLPAPAPAK